MSERIARELEALDPAPFRRVLARLLESMDRANWKGIDLDKRVRSARELAMLIGFAQPSVIVNNNALVVGQMSDADLLRELALTRQALGMNLALPGGKQELCQMIEGEAKQEACQIPAAEPGGLGAAGGTRVYAEGAPPAQKKPGKAHDTGMERAAHQPPPAPPADEAKMAGRIRAALARQTGKDGGSE